MVSNVITELLKANENGSASAAGKTQARLPDIVPSKYFRWKSAVGRLLAIVLLVPGVPLMALLVLLVRLTSHGSAIFRQTRVGRDGKIFVMYKIRTMVLDAEAITGPMWSEADDPRVTRIGNIMRSLHLDELPQLFNVVKGEMTLIGPRPERPEIVDVLAREIPDYLNRLSALPGITGLAQINLPPDTDLNSVRRKLVLDLDYVRNACLTQDLRILLCTSLRIFGMSGERAMRLMRLHRRVVLERRPSDRLSLPALEEARRATCLAFEHGNSHSNGHSNGNGATTDGCTDHHLAADTNGSTSNESPTFVPRA